jgi:hypothetical protein
VTLKKEGMTMKRNEADTSSAFSKFKAIKFGYPKFIQFDFSSSKSEQNRRIPVDISYIAMSIEGGFVT